MCWEADAKMIAEFMSAGRLTGTDAFGSTMQESAPSQREGGNGFCSIPNAANPAVKAMSREWYIKRDRKFRTMLRATI
jgi:hypothetical protein